MFYANIGKGGQLNMCKNKGKLITISGPAAAGIGTVTKVLTTEYDNFEIAPITTTREKRDIEDSDRKYYFVTKEDFEKSVAEGKLIEYVSYAGNYYGTSKESVFSMLDSGINVILAVGYENARKVKEAYPDAITTVVLSSLDENSIAQGQNADIILVNQSLKETVEQLVEKIKEF